MYPACDPLKYERDMPQISLRLDDDLLETLDAEADDRDVPRSKHIRDMLESRKRQRELEHELEQMREKLATARDQAADVEELTEQVEELERENERLHRERRQLLEQREEHTELVRYAEQQQSVIERQEERRDAPVWRRAKWWMLGRSNDETSTE
jgi:septal ring factor EnvC (AmiA/AmiB activator)